MLSAALAQELPLGQVGDIHYCCVMAMAQVSKPRHWEFGPLGRRVVKDGKLFDAKSLATRIPDSTEEPAAHEGLSGRHWAEHA